MFRLLLKKAMLEAWPLLLACSLMVFAFCWTRVWIVTRFELQRFEAFLEQLRPFEQFMPVPLEQVLTYAGSLALTFDEPVLLLCVLVWSISRGSDVVSGELGRGTLEMLLAQPVSRLQLMWAHCLIAIGGLACLASLVWCGLYAGIQTNQVRETVETGTTLKVPFTNLRIPLFQGEEQTVLVPLADRVDASLFLPPCLNLFAFSLFILSLSTLVSAVDRYRWRTIGIVVGFYVLQLLLYLLAKSTPETRWCHALTFFSLYSPSGMVNLSTRDPQAAWALTYAQSTFWVTPLGPLGLTLTLFALSAICFTLAGWVFQRRDLPAPV